MNTNTKEPALYRIRLRASNCYLLIDNGAVLIDAGLIGEGSSILKAMASNGVRPQDLRLILLTHGHADHAGAASEIASATGAPVALRFEDARWVSEGLQVPAPPVTRWARAIGRLLSMQLMHGVLPAPRFVPDVVIVAEELTLATYGIAATVIHTPGHTAGSVSVLLDDGRALVGDLAMNGLPSSPFKPTTPIIAQDPALLARSWTTIRERGATTIFPGHGSPFPWTSLVMSA
ncbi:MAG TPA: MBL fold metallo-hydrolase [Anaerolineales bacterium]|nr:MBL fold metallo-hydrolase [Anaerolineales bacterium]